MTVEQKDISAFEAQSTLHRLVRLARDSMDVRYAALAILDRDFIEIEFFATAGIDEQTREAIGAHPRGRGVLGPSSCSTTTAASQ